MSDKYANEKTTIASKRMLQAAGVKLRRLESRMQQLVIDFTPQENDGNRCCDRA